MSVKIRLQRHGRSKSPFYHVVVADSRAPRDGKFIEKIGSYLPQTQPATIELDVDRATYWLENGAQPTDTCRAILSYKGALMKSHLAVGVKKGAMTQEQADEKFANWISEKESKVQSHVERVKSTVSEKVAARLAEEAKVNAARLSKIAAKVAAAEAAANPVIEEEAPTEGIPAEDVAAPVEAAAIVEEVAAPVEEVAAPVEETAAPVEDVAAPAEAVAPSEEAATETPAE
jgi:small subunit ribosomal protein S16